MKAKLMWLVVSILSVIVYHALPSIVYLTICVIFFVGVLVKYRKDVAAHINS